MKNACEEVQERILCCAPVAAAPYTAEESTPFSKAYGVYHEGGMPFADNPHTVRLADFRLRKGERFVYEYDMGDFWQHDVRLEQVLPLHERTRYPVCIAGSGDCPPEDCGGPAGYAAFLLGRGSWAAMHEVSEAMAVVAERIPDWQQGGSRPTWDDKACRPISR